MRTQTKNTYKPLALPVTLCQSCCHCEQEWVDFCSHFQQEADERNGRYVVLHCTGYTQADKVDPVLSHSA